MKYEKLTRLPTNSQVAGIRRRWIEEEEEDSENEGRRRGSETSLAKVISAPCCFGRVKL